MTGLRIGVPYKLGVVIPTYPDNIENSRIVNYTSAAISFLRRMDSEVECKVFMEQGERVPSDIADVNQWIKHDRAIAKCRWDGMHHAFEWGADEIIMIDTDCIFEPNFLFLMLHSWRDKEAKTCHVSSTETDLCRHLDDHQRQLPDTTQVQDIAGEIIMIKRSLWERMNKDVAQSRANEDFEIADKVRAAGAVYNLCRMRIWSD